MSELEYSDEALAILAEFNGCDVEKMREIKPEASNKGMFKWLELAAFYRANGGEPFHGPRHLKLPREMT